MISRLIFQSGEETNERKAEANLQLNSLADLLRRLAHLPQCDGQVLGPVGVQQGHFVGSLLNDLLLVHSELDRWTLSFSLKHLLEFIDI